MDEVMVTVLICTYNQQDYIRDALDGAIMQRTNFKFEVLVHDDASTDATGDIIKEYAEQYPDIVIPFLEETNQFEHFENVIERMLNVARGKYLACCDGDDYWIDELKLQTQFDFMEANPDFSLCTHNTRRISVATGKEIEPYVIGRKTGELKQDYVIERACALFHTSSHFFRLRSWYEKHGAHDLSDLPRVIHLADDGRVMYFDSIMSVYRLGTKGSYTEQMRNIDNYVVSRIEIIGIYEAFDKETGGRWHNVVEKACKSMQADIFTAMRSCYRDLNRHQRFAIWKGMTADFLGIYPLVHKVKLYVRGGVIGMDVMIESCNATVDQSYFLSYIGYWLFPIIVRPILWELYIFSGRICHGGVKG